MSAWIKTTDMLPQENSTNVLVVIKDALEPCILFYHEGCFYDENVNTYNVTHWQHLPELPDELCV